MAVLTGVRTLLVDLEGTIFQAGNLVPGATRALETIRSRGISCVFVTNTSSRPRSVLVSELSSMAPSS
jgi:ribonucleotide monophosphatase NagD (HAD superfamily)